MSSFGSQGDYSAAGIRMKMVSGPEGRSCFKGRKRMKNSLLKRKKKIKDLKEQRKEKKRGVKGRSSINVGGGKQLRAHSQFMNGGQKSPNFLCGGNPG